MAVCKINGSSGNKFKTNFPRFGLVINSRKIIGENFHPYLDLFYESYRNDYKLYKQSCHFYERFCNYRNDSELGKTRFTGWCKLKGKKGIKHLMRRGFRLKLIINKQKVPFWNDNGMRVALCTFYFLKIRLSSWRLKSIKSFYKG